MDGLDLLVQVEIALVFLHLALDATTDFFVHIQYVDFALDLFKQIFQARLHPRERQHRLLVFQFERQMRRNSVGQAPRIVDAGDGRQDLGRNFFVQFDVMVKLLHHRAAKGFDFAGFIAGIVDARRLNRRDIGREVLLAIGNQVHVGALVAFDQNLDRAVGQLEHLQNRRDAADLEHIAHRRLVLGRCFLGHQHDAPLGLHGRL